MESLPLGKIPIRALNATVLKLTGAGSGKVVTPARAGIDFAAVKVGRKYLVVSADPITGVTGDIGTYAVKVAANDVATSGNQPQFAESVILLPERSSERDLERMARQIHTAAKGSGITILGGHTEVTPGLQRPIVVVTVFSLVDKFVTSGGARNTDTLMMTKTAGLEGTSELAREYGFSGSVAPSILRNARRFIELVDITKEAVAAFSTGRVHAMHDCTEGGVIGGAYEMSFASDVGFQIDRSAVPVARETRAICRVLSIDPLRLIGSGSLLIAVEEGAEESVEDALRPICRVSRIGKFRREGRLVLNGGSVERLKDAPQDELWGALGRTSRRGHGL